MTLFGWDYSVCNYQLCNEKGNWTPYSAVSKPTWLFMMQMRGYLQIMLLNANYYTELFLWRPKMQTATYSSVFLLNHSTGTGIKSNGWPNESFFKKLKIMTFIKVSFFTVMLKWSWGEQKGEEPAKKCLETMPRGKQVSCSVLYPWIYFQRASSQLRHSCPVSSHAHTLINDGHMER